MIAVLNCIVKHDMKVVWVDTYSIKFTYSVVKSRVIQRLDHRSSFFGEGSKHPVFSFFLSVYDLRVICILGVLKRNQRFILIDFKDTHITIYSLWPYWSGTLSVLMILQVYCYLLLYSSRFSILWQSVNLELFVCISQRILLSHLLSSRQIYPLVVAFLVNQEWEVLHLVLVVQLLQTKVGSDQFNLTHHINQLIRCYSVMETQLILVRYVYQREK